MLTNKKYFSIYEVSQITSLSLQRLRYIEKNDNNIRITRIRQRRYYKINEIEYIKEKYPIQRSRYSIIDQIEQLKQKFMSLREEFIN